MMSYEQQLKDQRQAYASLLKYIQEFCKHQELAARAMSDFAREMGALQYSNACPQALRQPFSELSDFSAELTNRCMGLVEACNAQYECFALDFKSVMRACENSRRAQVPFIQDANKLTLEAALQFELQRLALTKECNIAFGRAFSAFSAGICESSGRLEVSGRLICEDDARLSVATEFQGVDFGEDVYALCGVRAREYRSGRLADHATSAAAFKKTAQRHKSRHESKEPLETKIPLEGRQNCQKYRIIDQEEEANFQYFSPSWRASSEKRESAKTPGQPVQYAEYAEFTPGYQPKSAEFSIAADKNAFAPTRTEKYNEELLFQPQHAPGKLMSVQEIDQQLAYLREVELNMKAANTMPSPANIAAPQQVAQISALNQRSSIISPQTSENPAGFSPMAIAQPQQTASQQNNIEEQYETTQEPQKPQELQEPPKEQIIVEETPKKKRIQPKPKPASEIELDFEEKQTAKKPEPKKGKLPQIDLDNLL